MVRRRVGACGPYPSSHQLIAGHCRHLPLSVGSPCSALSCPHHRPNRNPVTRSTLNDLEPEDLQTITFSKKPSVTTRRAAAATSTSASVKKAPAPKADKPSSPIKKIAKKRPVRSAGLMKNENDAPQEVLPEITSPFNVTKHASENPFAVLAEMNEREEAGSVLAEQAQPMAEQAQPMAEKAATKKPSFFGMFINFFAKKTVTKSA